MKILNQPRVLQTDIMIGFEGYLYEREHATSTIRKYLSDVRIFQHFLPDVQDISKKAVLEYKEWLLSHYAPSSANSMIVSLNRFLEYLGLSEMKVKQTKIQKRHFLDRDKELTKKEYERLKETAQKQKKEQLSLEIETMAVTGARVSELAFFTVERVRLGRIDIYNKGKRRALILVKKLKKALLNFAAKKGITTGYIFVTRTGKPKDRSNLWREMKKLGQACGVEKKKIFPHNLRHLFARTYYQMTKDLAGLADLLGHSSMDVTRIYTAETGESFQRKIEKLGLLSLEDKKNKPLQAYDYTT